MNTSAQVFILCEDTVHYHFARKYFELLGFDKRKIRGDYNPRGRSSGSGAVFVQTHYEKEVKAFKSKNYLERILIIIIDDDTKDNANNLYQKYNPLPNEAILIFSPVRNIESWFCYIDDGNAIIEDKDNNGNVPDYKSRYRNSKPTAFAKKLKNEICLNGLPENAPSSLHRACSELDRL
ncbi:MAG: hypothetical protein IPN42_17350 [Methylococcaceae bacterium]|nr:hypothetical protein [Methylococcaceae bacterium]